MYKLTVVLLAVGKRCMTNAPYLIQSFYKGLGTVKSQTKSSHMHALPRRLNLSSTLRRSSSPPSLLPGKDSKEDKRVLSYPFFISSSPCGEDMQVRGVSQAFQPGDTAMALRWQSGLFQKNTLHLRNGQYGTASLVTPPWSSQATPKSNSLTWPKTWLTVHTTVISSRLIARSPYYF